MPVNKDALGKRIQIQRKRKRLSQYEFSDRIDKTPTFISYIENGNKCMSMDTFVDVVNALETTPNELLRDSIDLFEKDISITLPNDIGDCTEDEKRIVLELIQTVRKALSDQV